MFSFTFLPGESEGKQVQSEHLLFCDFFSNQGTDYSKIQQSGRPFQIIPHEEFSNSKKLQRLI